MRRGPIVLVLAVFAGAAPANAQGLGWLFGDPTYRQAHRRSRPPPSPAEIPLPPPRPRFPGDEALPAHESSPATREAADEAAPSSEPVATNATPPLPPERPPEVDRGPAPAAPPKPADLAPHPPTPTVAPSGATTASDPRQPVADAGCADRLKTRGVVAEATTVPPQPDARCTVVQPMRLVSAKLADGAVIDFPDKPTVACTTADAFSAYVHDLLAPLARGTWGVGLAAVWTGPGLECRSRDHIFGAKLSAHGQGLAVDIAQLGLADGRKVAVGEPQTAAERDFETAARAGGCGYFHTVLGPGSDSYHRTHWHFDLEVRGREGDSKYCK